MFYSRLLTLCKEHGVNVTNLISEMNLSSGNLSRWKNGGEPRGNTLSKLADYFHVSTDYLLGRTDDPRPVAEQTDPAPVSEGGTRLNTIKIAGRDGSLVERELTDEQLAALKLIVDQLPDADNL